MRRPWGALGASRWLYPFVVLWCRVIWFAFGIRYRAFGLDNVPRDAPYVIISNHCSHLDGPTLILALPHPIYFVIKRELTRIPIWGPAVVKLGFIAIDRGDSVRSHEQIKAAIAATVTVTTLTPSPPPRRSPRARGSAARTGTW